MFDLQLFAEFSTESNNQLILDCLCVCVCVREREREGEGWREGRNRERKEKVCSATPIIHTDSGTVSLSPSPSLSFSLPLSPSLSLSPSFSLTPSPFTARLHSIFVVCQTDFRFECEFRCVHDAG